MTEISLNKITKSFGFGKVLDNISFEIKTNEIVAIVGENGGGKSTILKMINGEETPDSGNIAIRKNATIGYLEQINKNQEQDIKVKDLLYKSAKEINELEKKLKTYEEKMLHAQDKELDKIIIKYTNLQEKFISIGGYEITERIGKIVNGFKINSLLESNYNTLSGGEKRIVTFASIMIDNPDILLLDEPTNHLDIDTINWLENYLKDYKGTILLVSHDRYFLDKVASKIILLERSTIDIFFGNYSYFIEENEKRIMLEFKDYKDQQKLIKKMKDSIKRLREYGRLAYPGGEPFYKRAKSIEKRLEKLEKLDKPRTTSALPISFKNESRSGNDVLIIEDLNISYENKIIFSNANMELNYNDKACILGKNGGGKSTLIKEILKGNDCIKKGSNIKIGYIPQEITFDKDDTIYNIARKYFKGEDYQLRSALYKFLFIGESIQKRVSKLSGGEKVRLKLFCIMQEDINFLILDEPTNHIDITTREILEETLQEYKGTVLFVSHDRYFINKVATRVINIDNHKLINHLGNYDDFIRETKTTRK